MSFDYKLFDYTMKSSAATVLQYAVMVFDTTVGVAKLPAAANAAKIAGIAQQSVSAANQSVPLRFHGHSRAIAQAATSIGDMLAVGDTSGRVAANNAPGAGTDTVGRGFEAGTALGDIISVLVFVGSR